MKKYLLGVGALLLSSGLLAQSSISPVHEKSTPNKRIKKLISPTEKAGTPIWGVGSTQGVAEAEFSNAFVQAGSFAAGNNPTSWTALSVNESGGAVTPGAAYWTRNLLGYSQGAYWGGTTPIGSPSNTNGVAIFDSDFMDNNGTPGAFGTGTSPSPHRGELISPRMDLTGYTDSAIAVSFYGLYREFQINELSISFSTDDGATWIETNDYRSYIGDMIEGQASVIFDQALMGVANLTQCRLKFNFDGDYYFAIIDDISVVTAAPYDLTFGVPNAGGTSLVEAGDQLHVTNNRYFPIDFLAAGWHDDFGANILNFGFQDVLPADQAKVVMNIEYDNAGTWTSVYMDSVSVDTVYAGGYGTGLATLNDFSWAQAGDFRVTYTAVANISDADPNNNTITHNFTLTDNSYLSKVDMDTLGNPFASRGIFPGGGPYSAYEYGSVHYLGQPTETISLDSISATFRLSTGFTGAASQNIIVNVYQVTDASTGVLNDDSFLVQLGVGIMSFNGLGTTIAPGDYFSATTNLVDAGTGGAMGDLDGGEHYYISFLVNPSLTGGPATFDIDDVPMFGVSEIKNMNLNNALTASDTLINTAPLAITDGTGTKTWYWTGFGTEYVPSLGMHITTSICAGPVASFSSADNGLVVDFTDASTFDTGATFVWDFGDGNTSTMQNPTHTYAADGSYTVCLIVADNCGADTICNMITVAGTPCPDPVSAWTSSINNLVVDFTDASTPVGSVSSWMWDFGDGNTSTMQNPTHTYSADGTYNVCLTVTDSCGSDSSCMSVTVADAANSLSEDILANVSLYPNPANNLLVLNGLNSLLPVKLQIVNVLGQVLEQKQFVRNTTINTADLAEGIYFLQLELDGSKVSKRFVVKH
jgi:PKD repeat protein